jgi:hypothetical protein
MAKNRETYLCTRCESTVVQWVGRCPQCGEWNTLMSVAGTLRGGPAAATASAVPLRAIDTAVIAPLPSGISELDRVLAGGSSAARPRWSSALRVSICKARPPQSRQGLISGPLRWEQRPADPHFCFRFRNPLKNK